MGAIPKEFDLSDNTLPECHDFPQKYESEARREHFISNVIKS